MEINSREHELLHILNSVFEETDLVFHSLETSHTYVFEILPEECNTEYGIELIVYKNSNELQLSNFSACQQKKGTLLLELIKMFACEINSPKIILIDKQSLDVMVDIPELRSEFMPIEHFAFVDIAIKGESWYNKMGFYREDSNPQEDKIRNMLLSDEPLSILIQDVRAFKMFQDNFPDIDMNDSIKNVFTNIKQKLIEKTPLTITQFETINYIIKRYLTKYFIYEPRFPINTLMECIPNCKKIEKEEEEVLPIIKPKSLKRKHSKPKKRKSQRKK